MINDNSWVIHGNYMLKKKENTPLSWSGGGYSRDGSHQKDGASVEEGSRIEFSIGGGLTRTPFRTCSASSSTASPRRTATTSATARCSSRRICVRKCGRWLSKLLKDIKISRGVLTFGTPSCLFCNQDCEDRLRSAYPSKLGSALAGTVLAPDNWLSN